MQISTSPRRPASNVADSPSTIAKVMLCSSRPLLARHPRKATAVDADEGHKNDRLDVVGVRSFF
jgi:hypothetical protein